MRIIQNVIYSSLLIFSLANKVNAQDLTLDPQSTVIVFSSYEDNLSNGTKELQKWLRKIYRTDKGFEYLTEPMYLQQEKKLTYKTIISLGPTHWVNQESIKKIKSYGFNIKRTGNIISIVGEQPRATLNGIIYFLDKYCGVRYYMPSDLFTSLPVTNKVTLKNIDITEEPFTQSVFVTGLSNNINFEIQWARNNGLDRKNWQSHQHSMGTRFPVEKFAQKYPEIYPLRDGKRCIPKGPGDQQWQPDFAEPHLVDAAVESAIEYFKSKPNVNHISFSVQDSGNFPKEGKMAQELEKYPKTPQEI